MPTILEPVLRLLRKLYGSPGQLQAPAAVEYGLPIQIVHDVSREAELGTYSGLEPVLDAVDNPFFTINVDHAHAAANVINTVIGIYSNQNTGWALPTWVPPDPREETVWVLGAFANISVSAVLNTAAITNDFLPKAGAGAGNAAQGLFFVTNGNLPPASLNGEFATFQNARFLSAGPFLPFPITNKLSALTPLEFISQSTDVVTVDFFVWCLRLPAGVFPPGLR